MNLKRKLNQWQALPYVSYLLIGLIGLMYLALYLMPIIPVSGLISVDTLLAGQIGSFILASVNTISLQALVIEGLILYFVGGQLEALVGHWRIILIYLLSGLAGLITQGLFLGTATMTVTVGMAVFGIFGAFLMLGDVFKENAVLGQLARNYWVFLAMTIGLSFIFDHSSLYGSLGGVFGGFLSAMALGAPKVGKINPVNRIISGLVYVVALILFAYLGMNR